ncbi:MAG: WYL domain-containing protein [Acidobacteria bacterium]|nr:WYL domain-containing protein [Acidobacteriota bacterium]
MRNEQLIRQWKILTHLSACSAAGYRQLIEALHPEDAVSLRTLQRDLQALEMAGFALETERHGKEVFWSLRLKHGLPFPIEIPELIACYAATLAARVQDLPESKHLEALCQKIIAPLPSKTRAFLEAAKQALLVLGPAGSPAGAAKGRINQFTRWAVESKTVEILYDSLHSGRRRWRRVDPYAIITTPSGSYLWGYCQSSRQFRVFHLARMRESRPTGEVFRKLDVSAPVAFQGSFEIWQGKPEPVCIRFTGRAALLAAEKQWHPSQTITKTRDCLDLRLTVHPGKDLERWILGFGAEAEVITPGSLRERIAAELQRAAQSYPAPVVQKKPVKAVRLRAAGRARAAR